MLTVLIIVLINWGLIFTVPYVFAFIVTRFDGVESTGLVSKVLYVSWSDESLPKKFFRKHVAPEMENFSFGAVIYFDPCWLDDADKVDAERFNRLERHERCHVRQQIYFGALQWLLYAIFYKVHGYKNNFFEKWAKDAEIVK